MRPSAITAARRRLSYERESGQATVEFALILFPLLILVTGIIYFGIGLNYWLDMQRIANQGARWAAVTNWPPDCPRASTSCPSPNTLQESLKRQALTRGLRDNVLVSVCYPGKSPTTATFGDPVRVRLESDYNFFFMNTFKVKLVGEATMRLELDPRNPDKITNELPSCPT